MHYKHGSLTIRVNGLNYKIKSNRRVTRKQSQCTMSTTNQFLLIIKRMHFLYHIDDGISDTLTKL